MTMADIIQIAILVILTVTMLLFLRQLRLQSRVLNAQLLRDRFEMYWKTYEPVTEEDVQELHLYPDDYMDNDKYQKVYKDNPQKIRRYIGMLTLYEYLAFSYTLKTLHLPDPLGYKWTERWTRDLLENDEFRDVHLYQKEYYPEFAVYIDRILATLHAETEQ